MFRKTKKEKDEEKLNKFENIKNEFRAQVNKTTSFSLSETPTTATFIIKKDIHDYKIIVIPTEAPIQNFDKDFDILTYEEIIGERGILDKEIFPFNEKIQKILGENANLRIKEIRLCIGTEDDFITLDEKDLENNDIVPSIQGLKEFILSNRNSIVGFCVRHFNTKKGNLDFLKCVCDEPASDIKSIKVKILSNLQQRGYYMQKYNKAYGLLLFIILTVRKIDNMVSDRVIELLKELNIPLEMIYLRRSSSIQNWAAIECKLDNMNLRNYLQSQFEFLSHFDVIQIANFCEKYNLDVDVALMMAEMLDKLKLLRLKGEKKDTILEREEIAAAGKIAATHFGIKEIELSKDLDKESIKKIENELNNFY